MDSVVDMEDVLHTGTQQTVETCFDTDLSFFHKYVQPITHENGHYVMVREIQQACYGRVEQHRWTGHSASHTEMRAVKVMETVYVRQSIAKERNDRRAHFSKDDRREDALTELGVFSYLATQEDRSPFLLRMLEISEDTRHMRLVTELADRDLFDELNATSGGMPEMKAAQHMQQILKALAYLHRHRIGHRDISLENVLLQGGEARLMDFGQAVVSRADDGTVLRYFGLAGKVQYRAPELHVPKTSQVRLKVPFDGAAGQKVTSMEVGNYLCQVRFPPNAASGTESDAEVMGYAVEPADVFSCGVVLNALLCGSLLWKMPVLGDPHFAYARREGMAALACSYRRDLAADAAELLAQMLHLDPAGRSNVEECLDASWFRRTIPVVPKAPAVVVPECASGFVLAAVVDEAEDIPMQ